MRSPCVLAVALAAACSSKSAPPAPEVAATQDAGTAVARPKTVPEAKAQTDVRVDRRTELIAIVYRLAGAREYTASKPTPYIAAVDAHFKPVAKHAAVEHARKLRGSYSISNDAPMLLAIHLDEQLMLRPGAGEAMAAMDHRWKGVDVEAFAAKLRDFAAASKYDEFLAAHADYHRELATRMRAIVDAENPVGWFDAMFTPREAARFVVVPTPLAGTMNFGPSTTLPDGTLEMYQVLGIHTDDGLPVADSLTVQLLVHEMAHSYVNPVLAKHRLALQAAGQQLFALVAPAMRRQKYQTWHTMLDESVVRAITSLYLKERKGDVVGADAARGEVRRGFVWTHDLVELLRRYQRDRATYPALDAYVPVLVDFFDALAKRYAGKLPQTPFLGPFDAVFNGDPMVIAAPVTDWEKLTKYVGEIHAQILATRGPLVPASPALLGEHPHKHVLAYGTPTSNAVIADVAARAGWKLTPAGITLGKKHYAGPTLVLIAVWFRHDDPTKGIAVYAASSDRLLPGINSLRHGDRDWLIARPDGKGNHVIVATGDWPQLNGAWVAPE